MSFKTIDWKGDMLMLLDQRILPIKEFMRSCPDAASVADAIKTMVVRGGPAIGVAAAFGLVLSAQAAVRRKRPWRPMFQKAAADLGATRPTAVNLFWAIDRMSRVADMLQDEDAAGAAARLEREALAIYAHDVEVNKAMGVHGAKLLHSGDSVLTHCNAGALATAEYGTALGIIRAAIAAGKKIHVFVDETRPWLQGARLTAWELMKDGIPCTLITDNMAASILAKGLIKAAIVGADRVAANGDVANKIGTYGVAVLCKAHKVPFYVAAPLSTIDPKVKNGAQIPIEEREDNEVTHLMGTRIAPAGVRVYNPAFDVTPARLVSGIVTEKGVLKSPYGAAIKSVKR